MSSASKSSCQKRLESVVFLGYAFFQMVLVLFSCSQNKIVAVILVLWSLCDFPPRLTDFRQTLLTFRSEIWDKQVTPGGHKVLLEPFDSSYVNHGNCREWRTPPLHIVQRGTQRARPSLHTPCSPPYFTHAPFN